MKKLLLMAVLLLGGYTVTAQAFSVGMAGEILVFENHLTESRFEGVSDTQINDLNGYAFIEADFFKSKFKLGPEFRYYASSTFDGERMYQSAAGGNIGFDGKDVGFHFGYFEPVGPLLTEYFDGIFNGEINFKYADKSFEPFINFNYYTNAKLFAYTYSVGAGFKLKF